MRFNFENDGTKYGHILKFDIILFFIFTCKVEVVEEEEEDRLDNWEFFVSFL